MAKKAPKVEVPLTDEQRIQAEYVRSVPLHIDVTLIPTPPSSRLLTVGQEVEYGNHTNCTVVAVFNEGRIAVVRKDVVAKKCYDSEPVTVGYDFSCQPWVNLLPKVPQNPKSFSDFRLPVRIHYSNSDIRSIEGKRYHSGLVFDADYQREYVWSDKDKERLIESIFAGRDIGKFVYLKWTYPRDTEVFDGKQRISTILDFMESRFPYKGVYYHELSFQDRMQFDNCGIQFAEIDATRYTRKDLLLMFLNLNAAGVPQTEEHLNSVREKIAECE